ncbi:MAG TPA: hypothetical protein DCP28_20480, partial [Cytophagales bacterium]|nr:hypothetical protein [Cytophagales bacterium]
MAKQMLLGLWVGLLSLSTAWAATTVSGTVTDAAGESLPGVNVQVQGTASGVVTDLEGRYRLQVTGTEAVLVFSYIGY